MELSARIAKFAATFEILQARVNWIISILAGIVLAETINTHTWVSASSRGHFQMLFSAGRAEFASAFEISQASLTGHVCKLANSSRMTRPKHAHTWVQACFQTLPLHSSCFLRILFSSSLHAHCRRDIPSLSCNSALSRPASIHSKSSVHHATSA